MVVQGQVVGARLARPAPDGSKLRDIAAEERGDVEEIPGAPIRRAKQQPELLERWLVPADRRTWLRCPGQQRRIRRSQADQVRYAQAEARRTLQGRHPFR